jgi:hypothetical protein
MAECQGVFEGRYPDKKGRIRLVSHFGELGYENRTQMKAASRILIDNHTGKHQRKTLAFRHTVLLPVNWQPRAALTENL